MTKKKNGKDQIKQLKFQYNGILVKGTQVWPGVPGHGQNWMDDNDDKDDDDGNNDAMMVMVVTMTIMMSVDVSSQ